MHGRVAVQARVDLLVDEALAVAVDEHRPHRQPRDDEHRGLGLVHAAHGGADVHAHLDPGAVVAAVGDLVLAHLLRSPLLEHAVVVDEPAGRQDHPARGAVLALLAELGRPHAHHPAVGDDQRSRPDIAVQRHAGLPRGGHQGVHQHVAGEVRGGRAMSSRRGPRDRGVGLGPLTHPHQSRVVPRHPRGGVPELVVELRTVRHQPVVVLDRARAVVGDLGLVRVRTQCRGEEGAHVLLRVLHPERPLGGGAAAQVDLAPRLRGRPPGAGRALQHDDRRAGLGRLDRRARPRDAHADHHHVRGVWRWTSVWPGVRHGRNYNVFIA